MDLWSIEKELIKEGYPVVCGVDEAGRGPLAGPVCAAAVILPDVISLPGLDDSKKLPARERERLYGIIVKIAVAYGVAYADSSEIDSVNILNATFLAMRRAIDKLAVKPDFVIIDGNRGPVTGYPSRCIVGGDGKSASIAAASILAKVERDAYMAGLARAYPGYGFEKHKGYGTKLHYEMLAQHGPSDVHRKSFLRKLKDFGC